jgi:shikimate kinase
MDKHIYLVGFMGSGKSTMGPVLASRMERPFYDLDDLIEEEQERTISEIFESQGEDHFRKLESDALVRNQPSEPYVMALGGGAFVSEVNRDYISQHGISVWLKIPLELARGRCKDSRHRPLATNPEEWASLFRRRESVYQQANIQVEVEGKSPQQICSEIQRHLTKIS